MTASARRGRGVHRPRGTVYRDRMDADDLGSSMFLLRMIPAATAAASVFVTLTLFGPMVLYVIARWRAHRTGGDPQLGLKFVLHWFAMSGVHLALTGAAIALYALISPGSSSSKGEMYRVAFGLIVPAGIVLAAHLVLLKRTNDEEVPGVRRLFLGYNTLVCGLCGFLALVLGFQVLFAKGSSRGVGHLCAATLLVFGTAWAVFGWKLMQLVLGGPGGFGAMPEAVPPPGPPQVMPPQPPAAGGGLPALGGGAYPPIEPR